MDKTKRKISADIAEAYASYRVLIVKKLGDPKRYFGSVAYNALREAVVEEIAGRLPAHKGERLLIGFSVDSYLLDCIDSRKVLSIAAILTFIDEAVDEGHRAA